MNSIEDEVGITSSFGGSVVSDERELAIDEGLAASKSFPSFHFVPDSNVVIREGEECVRRALEEAEENDGRAEEASEGDSFVNIKGSLEKRVEVNQKDSHLRTFCNVSETVLEGVVNTPDLPLF